MMGVEKEPFRSYTLDEEKKDDKWKILTIRLNKKEQEMLSEAQKVLEQKKDSTAIKQLFHIGFNNVIHDKSTAYLLRVIFKNKRNNERVGIYDFE